MSLRDIAKADAATIMRDTVTGFGWPFVVTSPAGDVYNLTGRLRDIHKAIDPETGQTVSVRQFSVTIVTSDIPERVVSVRSGAPWKVTATDIAGEYRVSDTMPDANLGITVLTLEALA